MTLSDLIAEHLKECSSDHCAACDCGWESGHDGDSELGSLAHADHLASVIADHFVVTPRPAGGPACTCSTDPLDRMPLIDGRCPAHSPPGILCWCRPGSPDLPFSSPHTKGVQCSRMFGATEQPRDVVTPPAECTCGRVWEGHPNPHAITCPQHVVTPLGKWGDA